MDGVSGKFLDWGMKTSHLIKLKPCDMELYPTQGGVWAVQWVQPTEFNLHLLL